MFFKLSTIDKIFKQAPWLAININLTNTGIEDLGQAIILKFRGIDDFKKIAALIKKSGGCPIEVKKQLTLIVFKQEFGKIKQNIYNNRLTYSKIKHLNVGSELSRPLVLEEYLKPQMDFYEPLNLEANSLEEIDELRSNTLGYL